MQALNVSAISAAENNIAYLMRIPFDCFTIAARLNIFAAHPELQLESTP
jgi:hypothetical protein